MIGSFYKVSAVLCLALVAERALAMDGRILSVDGDVYGTNNCVSVKIVLAEDDPALPKYLTPYYCQHELLSISNHVAPTLKVGGKICVENRSGRQYVFGHPYSWSGYDALEVDLQLANGNICKLKHRTPKFLSDDGSNVTLSSGKKWECLFSFDKRLWSYPPEVSTNKIVKIRPRFAFGAYKVDGKYYRTIDEIGKPRKERAFDDREGELVGEWIDYRHSEN